MTSLLIPDQLPAITFNGLNGPDRSWSCGNIRRISDAGSYIEYLTSLCGPAEAVSKIVDLVVQATEQRLAEVDSDQEKTPRTVGIGQWQGKEWGLMVYMEVFADKALVPLADILNAHPELLQGIYVLCGVDQPLFGCADTFWKLLDMGHQKPELREEAFALALRLCTTASDRGEEIPEDTDDDLLQAVQPSDPFYMVKDVNGILATFAAWDTARRTALKNLPPDSPEGDVQK